MTPAHIKFARHYEGEVEENGISIDKWPDSERSASYGSVPFVHEIRR